MLTRPLNFALFALSFFALQSDAFASPLRPLDLTGCDAFNSSEAIETHGSYGYQMVNYGALQQHIIEDVRQFSKSSEEIPTYFEAGAGKAFLPLRVFQHTTGPVRFIVNDLYPENLKDLLKLMLNPKNRELKESFKIRPGDCVTLIDTPEFQTLAPGGVHFLSALNLIHCMPPLKVVHFFASASEHLQAGGKFYVMHDADRPYAIPEEFKKGAEMLDEKLYRTGRSIFDVYFQHFTQSPEAKIALSFLGSEFYKKELERNNFEFPSYMSKKSIHQIRVESVDFFEPSPEFIHELASAVGLRLEKRGGMRRLYTSSADSQLDDATSFWYVFEKDGANPLHTPGKGHFRNSVAFKKLLQRAELAEKQRKDFEFQPQPWYPFVKEIPLSQRMKNLRLAAEAEEVTLPRVALDSGLSGRRDLEKLEINAFKISSLLHLTLPAPLEPKIDRD